MYLRWNTRTTWRETEESQIDPRGNLVAAADPARCEEPPPPNDGRHWEPYGSGTIVTGSGIHEVARRWIAWRVLIPV